MLHELLLALLGYTGDLIIDEREEQKSLGIMLSPDAPISEECTFKLAPDISFIEPSDRKYATRNIGETTRVLWSVEERTGSVTSIMESLAIWDVIERIITLGFYYRELERFATKSRNLSWIRSANESPLSRTSEIIKGKKAKQSVYRRAIANGVVEVLSVYRSAVLHIEQKLLSDSVPILATVTQGLNKFFVLLPPLYELILEIERDSICGGRLLNILHKRCHCGVPELQTCIQRLLWHGHQVMYNQLACWMVYGILNDQYGEFFINRQDDRDTEHDSSHPDMLEKFTRLSTNDLSLTDWHLGFHISLDMLPEYIPMRVAESILFAGKAVRVLRNPSPAFQFQDAAYPQHKPRGSQRIQGFLERFSLQKEPSFDSKIGQELLPQFEADKIEAMLQDLKESSEFHKRSFECAVDSIRAIAASHLWQLVVVRADLNGHLKALKDYFLLAKGDFFQVKHGQHPTVLVVIIVTSRDGDDMLWRSLVDVIESQWNVLQAHIQDSHDFTELVGFHQDYLSALISQSFLDIGSVSRILDGIMKLCLQFCWNIENQESSGNTVELEHITEEFNKKSNSLYTILRSSRLAGSQRAPFLRRFLLRLNFNSFFEATARGVMNVVRPRPTLAVFH
ncbi:Gamma-tubulin complex component 4 [Sarracenia purpurea var. burkii]